MIVLKILLITWSVVFVLTGLWVAVKLSDRPRRRR